MLDINIKIIRGAKNNIYTRKQFEKAAMPIGMLKP